MSQFVRKYVAPAITSQH